MLPLKEVRFFGKGEYAGELPRKFISFHCLENESNEKDGSITETVENLPELPLTNKLETVIIKETETSPAKSSAALQVAAAKESTPRDNEDYIVKGGSIAS